MEAAGAVAASTPGCCSAAERPVTAMLPVAAVAVLFLSVAALRASELLSEDNKLLPSRSRLWWWAA